MKTTPNAESNNGTAEIDTTATVVREPATQPPLPPDGVPPYDDWDEGPEAEFLPPRPRGRLLRPTTVLLFAALMASAGFLAGVLIEKHQLPSTTGSGSGRFASGTAAAATGAGRGGSTNGSGATVGQVSTVSGGTLYVTDSSGNTIKVTTSGAQITKTTTTSTTVHNVHAGDTVIVQGAAAAANGTIAATAVRDSGSSGSGSGAGGLFGAGGGSSSSATTSRGTSSTGGTSGSVNSLFGR